MSDKIIVFSIAVLSSLLAIYWIVLFTMMLRGGNKNNRKK